MRAEEILDRLYWLLGNAVLLPIPLREKRPRFAEWQKLTFAESRNRYSELRDAVIRGGNIGVLLGPASDRLIALDLDDDSLIGLWITRHPWLADTLRTKGKRGCQFFFRLEQGCEFPNGKAVYPLREPGKAIGELRLGGAGGAQSVIYGVHPDGMQYAIMDAKPPKVISLADLDELAPGLLFPGDPPQPEPKPATNNGVLLEANIMGRIESYLDKCERAVSGQRGHDTTYRVLCQTIRGFDLSAEQASEAAAYYNRTKCEPAWSEKELRHKVDDAWKATRNDPRGDFLSVENETSFSKELKDEEAQREQAKNERGDSRAEPAVRGEPIDLEEETEERFKFAEIQHPGDDRPISQFARELGDISAPHDFFRRFNKCVAPRRNEQGEIALVEIAPLDFRTAIETHCQPWLWRKVARDEYKKVLRTISVEVARTTLETVDYLERLHPVRAINRVRLPGFYDGATRLLPLGYCPVHQTYTTPATLPYSEDMPFEKAKEFLDSLFAEFPFAGDRDHAIGTVLAGALTLFAASLLPRNVIRPNFAALANSEGAGKTLLWKICLIPILGNAPAGTVPKDEDEMRKLIGATALGSSPVFFLDNFKGHLSSPSLEALTTSPTTAFRFLGQSKIYEAEHGLTVFITGNKATFSPDLRRRTLSVELFVNEVRPESRAISRPLDDIELLKLRPDILGAFWALVHKWEARGFPPPKQLNQSFTAWSRIVGGILEAAGYAQPTRQMAACSGTDGDRDLSDMESLVDNMVVDQRYTFPDLVSLARHHHLFERILGESSSDDGDALSPQARSIFGKILSDRFTDRTFANNGRLVRFEQLSKTARKSYGIRYLSPSEK